MAPELAQADDEYSAIDVANGMVDVYSYGVLLWTIATTEEPYRQTIANPFALMAQVVSGKRPPIDDGDYGQRIPDYLADLMVRCWDADPLKRPTFHAAVAELRNTSIEAIEDPKLMNSGGVVDQDGGNRGGSGGDVGGNGSGDHDTNGSGGGQGNMLPSIPAGYASFRDFGQGITRETIGSGDDLHGLLLGSRSSDFDTAERPHHSGGGIGGGGRGGGGGRPPTSGMSHFPQHRGTADSSDAQFSSGPEEADSHHGGRGGGSRIGGKAGVRSGAAPLAASKQPLLGGVGGSGGVGAGRRGGGGPGSDRGSPSIA